MNTVDYEDKLIDSLINITHIGSKVLLLTFGSDAVTAIHTNAGIVVIDAGISTGLTSKYKKIIEEDFQCKNFSFLINTHFHPDHYGGNSVFKEAEIIGHENGIGEIMNQWKDTLKVIDNINKIVSEYELQLQQNKQGTALWYQAFTQKMRYENALKDTQNFNTIRGPTLDFKDSLQISIGELEFEMIYFGKCHSNSDILIFVPELKMLFTGDLFFKYGRPSISDEIFEEKDKWCRAVKWIEKRISGIETIISGHGEILTLEDLKGFNKIIKDKS